jgi:lysozyme
VQSYLDIALNLIRQFEGFISQPYQDVTGTWTVGIGFTTLNSKPVGPNTPSLDEITSINILLGLLQQLDRNLATELFVELTNHQRAALLSLAYNIGLGNLGKSTLLKYVNEGAFGAAASQFLVWTYSKGVALPGLAKRRQIEMECFLIPD